MSYILYVEVLDERNKLKGWNFIGFPTSRKAENFYKKLPSYPNRKIVSGKILLP